MFNNVPLERESNIGMVKIKETIKNESNNGVVSHDFIHLNLYDQGCGVVSMTELGLSDREKAIVRAVQGADMDVQRFLLRNGHKLLPIVNEPTLVNCSLDPITGIVYDKDKKEVHFSATGYQGSYFMRNGVYLHRLMAEQVLLRANEKRYWQVIGNLKAYEAHHRRPELKKFPHGNNGFNIKLLDIALHKDYSAIVRKIERAVKDGMKINIVKPIFYFMF
jgi:hypothetical protein